MRYCIVPGCSELQVTRFCAKHAAEQEHARTNWILRRLYRTSRWTRLRGSVLEDQPFCSECSATGLITASHDVHHIRKATAENFFDRSNLQALCHAHHSEHTQRGE